MTEPIDWRVVDGAIHDWAVAALPVAAAQVIWANQNLDQPDYPYVTLLRSGFAEVGSLDEIKTSYDSGGAAGEEIALLTTGPREVTLSLTAHVDADSGAYRNPNTTGPGVLSLAHSSLGQRSVLDGLAAGGIALIERLPVVDTSVVVNGQWVSQAAMDVRLRVVSEMTEQIGYFDKVELTSTLENAKDSLDLDDYLIDGSQE